MPDVNLYVCNFFISVICVSYVCVFFHCLNCVRGLK